MRVETLRQLQNAYETVALYFRFLHLGYFFDDLSKRINSSRLVRSIDIATPQNLTYKLNQQLIVDSLENIYNNPNKVSVFSHLTLLNALRGVTMAVVEGFEKTKINGASELQEVYQNEIFLGNQRLTDSFAGVLKFVRNALSHNINDKIELTEKDFADQKKSRTNPKNLFGPTMHFYFDYDDPNSVIRIPDYKPGLDIEIDLTRINPGDLFDSVFPTYQGFLLIEFCYNSLFYLENKYTTNTFGN